jgi:protein TonB
MRAAVLVLASVAVFGVGCGQETTPVRLGGDVKPPRVIETGEPELPDDFEGKSRSVSLTVYLWVDEKGIPSHVRIVKSSAPELNELWVAAVQKYRFAPAMLDGEPVAVDMSMGISADGY